MNLLTGKAMKTVCQIVLPYDFEGLLCQGITRALWLARPWVHRTGTQQPSQLEHTTTTVSISITRFVRFVRDTSMACQTASLWPKLASDVSTSKFGSMAHTFNLPTIVRQAFHPTPVHKVLTRVHFVAECKD